MRARGQCTSKMAVAPLAGGKQIRVWGEQGLGGGWRWWQTLLSYTMPTHELGNLIWVSSVLHLLRVQVQVDPLQVVTGRPAAAGPMG